MANDKNFLIWAVVKPLISANPKIKEIFLMRLDVGNVLI